MEGRLDATREALRSPFPWITFSAALALTAAAWFGIERIRHEDARALFDRRVDIAAAALRSRVVVYEQILRAGAANVAASPRVSREEWSRFIAYQQLAERFPGVQSVGYAEVSAADSVVVRYLEPHAGRNLREIGADLRADPARAAAIDKARESGEAAITSRLAVGRDAALGDQPGFFMFVPVFHEANQGGRREAVSGYVFSPIRIADLVQAITEQGVLRYLDLRIYDQPEGGTAQVELVDTRIATRAGPAAPALFERVLNFPMPGRAWTVRFVSRPDFDAALRAERPWLIMASGLLAAVVGFLLTTALVEAWSHARGLSFRDPLTGLFNRRYHDATMPRELARARRSSQTVGLIAMDVDGFKRLNDTFGHEAGDSVLMQLGELLRTISRAGDIACRFGGEEFALILPGASAEVTRGRAEAIRAAFASLDFIHQGRSLGPITLSAGVAALPPTKHDWAETLRAADRALYAAKQAGRNRVVSAADL